MAAKPRISANAIAALLTVLFAFAVRFFSFQYTYAINNDGVFYIHQARAIYYGDWSSLLSCSITYLSNYPFFIAGAYPFFDDWVIAAKFVSFVFGSCTVIPMYFLFRHFFDQRVSILGTLIFALMPDQVAWSGDALRDPITWFFLALGILCFIRKWDENNFASLFLSSIFFLMASWARIEAVLFLCVSPIFLLATSRDRKIKRCVAFIAPIALAALIGIAAILAFHIPSDRFLRVHELINNLSAPVTKYLDLRNQLAQQALESGDGLASFFLPEARRFIWFIAIGAVIGRIIGAFYLPFFVIFLIGLPSAWKRMMQDRRILYLAILAGCGFIFLYAYTLYAWLIYNRFMAIVLFPSFVCVGCGIQKILDVFRAGLKQSEAVAVALLCGLVLAAALPKDLRSREQDKLVYREIGEFIAAREHRSKPVRIAGLPTPPLRWASFYANVDYPGAPCPTSDGLSVKGGHILIPDFKKEGIQYLLWEERAWSLKESSLNEPSYQQHLGEVGTWSHKDTGRLVLYEVK